jgi:hypothetical protein
LKPLTRSNLFYTPLNFIVLLKRKGKKVVDKNLQLFLLVFSASQIVFSRIILPQKKEERNLLKSFFIKEQKKAR